MTHDASAAGPICPSCGTAASGAFCSQCGAAVAAQCRRCEAALPPGARFCPKCGAVAARTATFRPGAGAIASAIAVAVLAALGVARWRGEAPSAPPADAAPATPGSAAAPAGEEAPPPDISRMTPQERFDRLYQRVMTATRTGDAATSQRFMPMALAAYEMLDSASADTRYHAAMLRLHSGDAAGARALGDSIVRNDSTNLLGYVLLGTVARFQRDSSTLKRISAAFMRRYDREIARDRPEYTEHRTAISDFRREASGEPPPRTPRAGG
jgi:hypothetical protein